MIAKAKIHDQKRGKIWPEVSLTGLHRDMFPVLGFVESVYRGYGFNPVLSGGTECFREDIKENCREFIHSVDSYHQQGRALDFSTRGIDLETALKIADGLQDDLDNYKKENMEKIDGKYQVIFEPRKTHIHIELDRL